MNRRFQLVLLTLALVVFLAPHSAMAVDDGASSVYTYNYDYWGEMMESPDAYRVEEVVSSASLGLEVPMNAPQSLFACGNTLYIVDRGNNRILQLEREGQRFSLTRIIDHAEGAEPETFNAPNDVFADENGNLYVADTNNFRIVMMDRDLRYIKDFTKPTDATFDQDNDFLPTKLVVDSAGRVFTLATNVNKGLIKYEADGTFTGFIGANKVTINTWDYIWKRYLSTKEQRAQMADFVPTEYKNLYIDKEGFIYATNTNFSEYDLLWDNAKPIRRLNMLGNDILIKNDRYPPIGDIDWEEGLTPGDYHGPSKLFDITVLDDDMYCVIDRSRGRIFGYDSQGIMLWAFGARGTTEGASNGAVSIEHIGYDLITLDEFSGNITVFTPTRYGQMIYQANKQYLNGDYDGSAITWKEIQKQNANYTPAYIGIGIAQMREEDYTGAMENFKTAHDRSNYSKAYRYYRQEWMEKNILWVALAIAALAVFLIARGLIRKSKWEVFAHDRSKAFKRQ